MTAIMPESAFRAGVESAAKPFVDALRRDGYVVLRNVIDRHLIEEIDAASRPIFGRTAFSKGAFYGDRTKRFMGLLNHIPQAAHLVQHPLILDIASQLLTACDTIQLNSTQAIELHQGSWQQPPHRDQIVWQQGFDHMDLMTNISVPFMDYRRENGTTKVWPGSHLLPSDQRPEGEGMDVEIGPGDAMFFSGRVVHCQGTNMSSQVRRGIIFSYSLGWLKQFENMMLTYPPEVARHFSPGLAQLIGYRMDRPNLGSVGGRCPSIVLKGNGQVPLGVRDAFLPEQTARILAFHASLAAQLEAAE